MDENREFIITALIVGAIIGAYIGGSQANGTYNPFKWDFNNVDTWVGMVGGATGAPINIHLDAENNITGNLELNAPTTNSVALDVQQPKLIPIETPDGGIKLISQFSESSIDNSFNTIINNQNNLNHIFQSKHNLSQLINQLGGKENTIRTVLNTLNGKLPSNGIYSIQININGIEIYVRGNVINGVNRIGTMYIK